MTFLPLPRMGLLPLLELLLIKLHIPIPIPMSVSDPNYVLLLPALTIHKDRIDTAFRKTLSELVEWGGVSWSTDFDR